MAELWVLESDYTDQGTSKALSHVVMMQYQVFWRFIDVNYLSENMEADISVRGCRDLHENKLEAPYLRRNFIYEQKGAFTRGSFYKDERRQRQTKINTEDFATILSTIPSILQNNNGRNAC